MRVLATRARPGFAVVVAEEPHHAGEGVTASFGGGAELTRHVRTLGDPQRRVGQRRGVGIEVGIEHGAPVEGARQVHPDPVASAPTSGGSSVTASARATQWRTARAVSATDRWTSNGDTSASWSAYRSTSPLGTDATTTSTCAPESSPSNHNRAKVGHTANRDARTARRLASGSDNP